MLTRTYPFISLPTATYPYLPISRFIYLLVPTYTDQHLPVYIYTYIVDEDGGGIDHKEDEWIHHDNYYQFSFEKDDSNLSLFTIRCPCDKNKTNSQISDLTNFYDETNIMDCIGGVKTTDPNGDSVVYDVSPIQISDNSYVFAAPAYIINKDGIKGYWKAIAVNKNGNILETRQIEPTYSTEYLVQFYKIIMYTF